MLLACDRLLFLLLLLLFGMNFAEKPQSSLVRNLESEWRGPAKQRKERRRRWNAGRWENPKFKLFFLLQSSSSSSSSSNSLYFLAQKNKFTLFFFPPPDFLPLSSPKLYSVHIPRARFLLSSSSSFQGWADLLFSSFSSSSCPFLPALLYLHWMLFFLLVLGGDEAFNS